ncbi:DUF4129 domain-containing protein [Arthrobacter antioxidans]|uniref:DUF4129 domain-containing protein n=1 Tax=Arthrobacter antioxidans TaxID=2895818 RepID=UPI001FFF8654|nr:DUF4129 domain-containing protein [Arthrobacter antioxidans]
MGTPAGPTRVPTVMTLIVLVLVVLAAAFVGDFSADPVADPQDSSPRPVQSAAPTETTTAPPLPDGERIVVEGGTLAATALVLLMLALALLTRFLLRFRGRHGPDGDPPQRTELQHPATVALVTVALPEWAAASRAALVSGGSTSDTIIRCWLELERVCAEAGVGRTPPQTTSDFASTVAVTLDLPPLPLASLNHLYQRARFGQAGRNPAADPLGPADRHAAAASVDDLARSLAARARQPGVRP